MNIKTLEELHKEVNDYRITSNKDMKFVSVDELVQEFDKHTQALANCDIIHIKGKAYDFSEKETSQGHYAGVQAQIQLIEQLLEVITKR